MPERRYCLWRVRNVSKAQTYDEAVHEAISIVKAGAHDRVFVVEVVRIVEKDSPPVVVREPGEFDLQT